MREMELRVMQDVVHDALDDLLVEWTIGAHPWLEHVRPPSLGAQILTPSSHRLDYLRHFSLRYVRFALRRQPAELVMYFNKIFFKFPL